MRSIQKGRRFAVQTTLLWVKTDYEYTQSDNMRVNAQKHTTRLTDRRLLSPEIINTHTAFGTTSSVASFWVWIAASNFIPAQIPAAGEAPLADTRRAIRNVTASSEEALQSVVGLNGSVHSRGREAPGGGTPTRHRRGGVGRIPPPTSTPKVQELWEGGATCESLLQEPWICEWISFGHSSKNGHSLHLCHVSLKFPE